MAASAALLANSFLAAPSFAAVTLISSVPGADPTDLTPANLMTAQAQCDAAAAALDTDGPSANSDRYYAEVNKGAVTLLSGPTEVGTEGDRAIDLESREGAGTFTPAKKEILGDPYRNGGSVNMFGIQQAVGGSFSNSSYDFTAQFSTTYKHAYTCDIYMENYNPEQTINHPAIGRYVVDPDAQGNEEAKQQSCNAFSAMQPADPVVGKLTPPWWGQPQGQCLFEGDAAYVEIIPESLDSAEFVTNAAGGSFNQTQTDELEAHESFGSGFPTSETFTIGQVVVCISPSRTGTKLPGAWQKQNGYTGDKCTTAWYEGGAKVGVPNLNDGSHNFVTVPVI
jgi:hypothetical protein